MKKQVTLFWNAARGVWTHDGSGRSFVGWDEPETEQNSFAKVQAVAKKGMAEYFSGLPNHPAVTADDIQIHWKQAPNRFQPPPVEVQLTNFQNNRPVLADDADAAAATTVKHKPAPPARLSTA